MNTLLWILQGLTAAIFLMAGLMKASKSKNELKEKGNGGMDWVDDLSDQNIKLIGIIEFLGGLGLILPQLTGILPWLSPVSAVGLAVTMIVAMIFHARRKDGAKAIMTNFFLLLLAAFVAYGRFFAVPAC